MGIENAEKIYKSAWHPKSFVSLDGANHLVTNQSDAEYIGQVLSSWSLRYVDQQDKIENDTKGHPVMVRLSADAGFTTEIKNSFSSFNCR